MTAVAIQIQPTMGLIRARRPRVPRSGSTFMIEDEVTSTGRNPESDVFLDDISVSRKHAEIRRHPDGFYIHALGSMNGTYVNRERVEVTKLAPHDEVQIGRFRLVFFVGE